mmetsp:Transcript_252/g.456  ORF Transcript_252/g.456 Transcript_252/m.456 type:complete len:336 (+) Transcript_252:73-1080(+)
MEEEIESVDSMDMNSCRVLSVQSHVVSGYVGNRAAIFPLQLLGFDADFINSVQFSNHTKYATIKGKVLDGLELLALTEGLEANNLIDYNYLLTGYIGSDSFLTNVLHLLDRIKIHNPNAKYVCDPVLGDNGKYYVPSGLVEIYKTSVIPRAYMITPNQFEAELLTGVVISNEANALDAMVHMLKMGPEIVVLTSAEFLESNGKLYCYCSRKTSDGSEVEVVRVVVNKKEGHYTGTGDCTAALMLAWIHLTVENLSLSLRNTVSTVQGMLEVTRKRQASRNILNEDVSDSTEAARARMHNLKHGELAVIMGKRYIENPPIAMLVEDVKRWTVPLNA